MPILYLCVINSKKQVIIEGAEAKFKSDYKSTILGYYDQFSLYAKKQLSLDSNHNMNYQHEGSFIIVSISTHQDVTLVEAFAFMDWVKQALLIEVEDKNIPLMTPSKRGYVSIGS